MAKKKNIAKKTRRSIEKIVDKLKDVSDSNKSFAGIFLTRAEGSGVSFVLGNGKMLQELIEETCARDDNFNRVIQNAAKNVDRNPRMLDDEDSFDKFLKRRQANNQDKNVEEINLEDGSKALSIKADSVDDLTDKEIDDILDKMINGVDNPDDE